MTPDETGDAIPIDVPTTKEAALCSRVKERELLQSCVEGLSARSNSFQLVVVAVEELEEVPGVIKGLSGVQNHALHGCARQKGSRATKREREGQCSEHEPELSRASRESHARICRGGPRIEGFLSDASGSEQGTCHDLTDIDSVELQALV